MRLAALTALSLLAAGPASSADTEHKDATSVQYVNVSPVAAPIVVGGRVINYVFVTTRLVLTSRADASRLRDKEPYFRDALVRDAYRRPFVKAGDYTHVDEGALIRALSADAARIAGPGQIAKVEIVSTQAQRIRGLATPTTGAGAERAPTP